MASRTITQKVRFTATPHDVYEALMDAKKHAAFTGGPATISRRVGGSFSVFDGYAVGKNLELVKDERIVQSWHASDWEEGEWSTVTFAITPVRGGCQLSFTQTGVPPGAVSGIRQGWKDFYWAPMKEMLENA